MAELKKANANPERMLSSLMRLNLWFSFTSKIIVVEICKNMPTTIANIMDSLIGIIWGEKELIQCQ